LGDIDNRRRDRLCCAQLQRWLSDKVLNMSNIISLAAERFRRQRLLEHREHVLRTYRSEITDWCGHDLACEITASRLNIPDRIVRNIVADAGSLF